MSDSIIKVSRNTDNAPKSAVSTQSVAFSHYNNISAQLPVDAASGALVAGGIKEQATQVLNNIKAIVESVGHPMEDVVKINIQLMDIADLDAVNEVYATYFNNYMPVRSSVQVAALPLEGALVQMDALLSNGEGTYPQDATPLVSLARNTDTAPVSDMYTQTVAFSHYNNISGQLGLDPKTGAMVEGGVAAQAKQALTNIKSIMTGIDVPFDDIVKATIYLKDLSDIEAVNEVYTTFFPDSSIARTVGYMPARTVVEAAALPKGALVMIDAVVSHGDGTPPQEVEDRHGIVIRANNTDDAPRSFLSTQTVAFSHYNHISAQLGVDAETGELVAGGAAEQAKQAMSHIKTIVDSIGHVMDDTVKINIQMTNLADLDAVNEVYTTFFGSDLPARTVVGVSTLPLGAAIQIDAIISNGEGTPPNA